MLYAVYYADLFDDSDPNIVRPCSLLEYGSFKEPVTVIWGLDDVVLFTVLEKDFYETIDVDIYFEDLLTDNPNMFLLSNTEELKQYQIVFTKSGIKLSFTEDVRDL